VRSVSSSVSPFSFSPSGGAVRALVRKLSALMMVIVVCHKVYIIDCRLASDASVMNQVGL
jgi:hypothetical protein